MEEQMTILTARTETLFRRIQNLYEEGKKVKNPVNRANFHTRYITLERTRSELEKTIDEINRLKLKANPPAKPEYAVLDSVDEMYCHIQVIYLKLIEEEKTQNSDNPVVAKKGARPRLPKIELPTFSGDLNEWPIFHESFKTLIHDNPDLSPVDKVYYLVGRLSGQAKQVCSGLLPTGDNYKIIWDSLVTRYQDDRKLADAHLQRIFDFKPLSNESAVGLDLFTDVFDSAVSAFNQSKIEDKLDYLLAYLALSKLDPETRRAYEMLRTQSEVPTYNSIIKFVQGQSRILGSAGSNQIYRNKTAVKTFSNPKSKSQSFVASKAVDARIKCVGCDGKENHQLQNCPRFLQLPPIDRYNLVRKGFLCLNCLNHHKIANCTSKYRCSVCQQKHHTLLHFPKPSSNLTGGDKVHTKHAEKPIENVEEVKPLPHFCAKATRPTGNIEILVSTVVVKVIDKNNVAHNVRLMLDSCSQANFLSHSCCQRLKLRVEITPSIVSGLGLTQNVVLGRTRTIIHSRFQSDVSYDLDFLVMEQVAHPLPNVKLDTSNFAYLRSLPLADYSFHEPGEIDGILNAQVYAEIMGSAKISGPTGCPHAIETKFGYVMVGEARVLASQPIETRQTFCALVESSIDSLMTKFWEVEEVSSLPVSSQEDLECEKIFRNSFKRNSDGRYTVSLPFKDDPNALGDSYHIAQKRFLSLERKLQVSPDYRLKYNEGMMDYISQNHISIVPENELNSPGYYIPHHGVWKLASTSTQLRIVFDASCRSSSSKSLNDLLFTGPKLQTDIFVMLAKFRLFKIALVSDIKQMYRQINIRGEHRRFQRLLYRFSTEEPIQVFQINTVAFGVTSSPYLAIRTLQQLARDEAASFPAACVVVENDMYIDDLVKSVTDCDDAIKLFDELVGLLRSGGFELLKWSTNSKRLLEHIPPGMRSSSSVEFEIASLKVLGLQWDPITDNLSFKVSSINDTCTKRNILSTIARIFDPLGLAAPVILIAKLLIKELWLLRIGWDESPPTRICGIWKTFIDELPLLERLVIPRHLGVSSYSRVSLIGFADASEKAYGAVIYVRALESNGNYGVSLLCSKSKVAPLKVVSIPRLELCAAHILAKLLHIVSKVYSPLISIDSIVALTDSTTALSWISSSPHVWKTFVANRTAKIQELIPTARWFHVSGEENPADKVSRGVITSSLIEDELWLNGPSWLNSDLVEWPVKTCVECTQVEKRVISYVITKPEIDVFVRLIERSSSFLKLLHSVVYVLRFCKRLPIQNTITVEDLEYAERVLIRSIQKIHFGSTIRALKDDKPYASELYKLKPLLDGELLRVGGRLSNSPLNYDQQHQFILPKNHHFVDLLIDYYHRRHFHTGPTLVLALLRQRYWILAARSVVRKQIRKCNLCFRHKPKSTFPPMADLPSFRVQQAKPFVHTGTDFAGPLHITLTRRRGSKTQKAYICLFVCLVTKAIHLELVSDLSTANFLQGFKRFISRRGPCSVVYSDNGTNFIGAHTVLKDLYSLVTSEEYRETFHTEMAQRKIQWKFNPPSSPHFGGSWESQVKCVKAHLYKAIGSQILSYEELNTLLVQIEALLNSRPLCLLSDTDPEAPLALTPAHFLNLTPLQFLPAPDLLEIPLNRLDRFQLIDRIVQHFWRRWHLEYLNQLQLRYKWNKDSVPLTPGMVVVVKEDRNQALQWPLGVIQEVFPNKDGEIRVVSVKLRHGIFKRPTVKICPLPTQ